MFADIDSDGDGLISAAEFTNFSDRFSAEASSALLQAQSEAGESSERFASLDTNGDGSLDQTEFEAGMPPPPPPQGGDVEALAADLFASIDADGNGTIDADELEAVLSQTSLAEDEDAASLLSALDADGDGSISESELKTALAALQPPPPPPPEETEAVSATEDADSADAAGETAAAEEESYDPLDTNEDGFVSFAEQLAGLRSGLISGSLGVGTMAALLQSVSVS